MYLKFYHLRGFAQINVDFLKFVPGFPLVITPRYNRSVSFLSRAKFLGLQVLRIDKCCADYKHALICVCSVYKTCEKASCNLTYRAYSYTQLLSSSCDLFFKNANSWNALEHVTIYKPYVLPRMYRLQFLNGMKINCEGLRTFTTFFL